MITALAIVCLDQLSPEMNQKAESLFLRIEKAVEVSRQMPTPAFESGLDYYSENSRRKVFLGNASFTGSRLAAMSSAFELDWQEDGDYLRSVLCRHGRPRLAYGADQTPLPENELRRRALLTLSALGPFPAEPTIKETDDSDSGLYRALIAWKFHGVTLDNRTGSVIALNRMHGGLYQFQNGAYFPQWRPETAVQGASLDHCRRVAEEIYISSGVLPYANVWEAGLVYGFPSVGPHWDSNDPYYSSLKKGDAILMFRIHYGWKHVYVDARNGCPISVSGFNPGYVSWGGQQEFQLKKQIETVEWTPIGSKDGGKLAFVRAEKNLASEGKAILKATDGSRIIRGNFNPDTGLLTINFEREHVVLKPDAKLAEALGSAKQR